MIRVSSVAVALSLSTMACAPAVAGSFAPDAYYEARFPVRATYADPATRQVPSGDWVLLNYQKNEKSLPGHPKVTGDIEYEFDTDGDGDFDASEKVKEYSLEYHHATTGANITFALEPLGEEDARLDLEVLARNYVERASGSGTIAINFGPGIVVEHTKKYASRVLDGKATNVGGLPAYVITFELANVDQLGLSPDSRWRRARVVFVRTPYKWVIENRHPSKSAPDQRFFGNWPVVGVLEYDADPKDFDAHLQEFGSLVGHVEFMDDARVIAVHSDALLKCARTSTATFEFRIGAMGSPVEGNANSGRSPCALSALGDARFAPLNAMRQAAATLTSPAVASVPVVPAPEIVAAVPPPTAVAVAPVPAAPVAAPALTPLAPAATAAAPAAPAVKGP
jgi:hypothetical protein